MDLSGELRNQIYTYALQGTQSDTFYDDEKIHLVSSPQFHVGLGFEVHGPQGVNFNILLCCKQTYQEGRGLLYSLNTFNIGVRSCRNDFEHDESVLHADFNLSKMSIVPKNTSRPKPHKGLPYRQIEHLFPFWSLLREVEIKGEFWDVDRPAYMVEILRSHPLLVIHNLQVALIGYEPFYKTSGTEYFSDRRKRTISILEDLKVRDCIYVEEQTPRLSLANRPKCTLLVIVR